MSWPDVQGVNYSNRSIGRRWFGNTEDILADVLWGRDGALRIELVSFYLGAEEPFIAGYELYRLPSNYAPTTKNEASWNTDKSAGTVPSWNIIGTGTHVKTKVTSPEAWEMIRDWIGGCVNNHKECKVVSEDRPFPTRIVTVGDDDTEPHLRIPSPR
jgi:hypothetical protein